MANAERGFASMDKQNKNNLQAQAGKQSQQNAQAHQFSGKEAQPAGKQAGQKNAQDKGHAQQHNQQHAHKGGKH